MLIAIVMVVEVDEHDNHAFDWESVDNTVPQSSQQGTWEKGKTVGIMDDEEEQEVENAEVLELVNGALGTPRRATCTPAARPLQPARIARVAEHTRTTA